MYDQLFQLLAQGLTLPPGWAMPPVQNLGRTACGLRKSLMWMEDMDGAAQLVRYYHGIVKSNPWAFLELCGDGAQYSGSQVFKPAFESPTLEIRRSLVEGSLYLGWRPTSEIRSLTGRLEFAESGNTLALGATSYPIQLQEGDTGHELILPAEFGARLSVGAFAVPSAHTLFLRPPDFDLASFAESLPETHYQELANSDLLTAYMNSVFVSDKLAIAWVAVHRIESAA